MFQSLAELGASQPLDYDLCIVGAGAAGITIANAFKDLRLRTCLVEGGGLESDTESQALYQGISHGYANLAAARLRLFGGTTNHWTGYCRAPHEEDLSARPWQPSSGWPLPIAEINRHLPEAMAMVEVPNQFDPAYWSKTTGARTLDLPSPDFGEGVSLIGPAVRFGRKYRDAIDQSHSVTCLLHANVVELLPSKDTQRIEGMTLKTLDGRTFSLRATTFVLACGGIENARVLLNSTSQLPSGIGNAYDLVGRYFSDHCVRTPGTAVLTRPAQTPLLYELGRIRGQTVTALPHLRTGASLAARLQLPSIVIRLQPETPSRLTRAMEQLTAFWDSSEVARTFRITTFAEPLPLADNRITLLDERDRLGVRRVKLVYKASDLEFQAITETLTLLGAAVGAAGRGRVRIDADAITAPPTDWGFHHFSTTKMHPDPKQGVVDTDCRVHGIHNLFVAGSSVFPTAGLMTPTLTIVALALRLAATLKGTFNA